MVDSVIQCLLRRWHLSARILNYMHFLRVHKVHSHRLLELFVYAFFGIVVSVGIFLLTRVMSGEPVIPAAMVDQGNALPFVPEGVAQ